MRNKRIILVGCAGSGKDYLASAFIDAGFKKDVSITTRPMRDGEVDGLTYQYVTDAVFDMGIFNDQFYEHVEFNGWKYGTTRDDWENADVFIMTPSGVSTIKSEDRKNCVIVYIDIDEDIRRKRVSLRSDADSTERRIKADQKDFAGFIDYDYRITDPLFNTEEWINILKQASIEK